MPSLWPKSEVLQLVTPQLGSIGRILNNSLALSLISDLRHSVDSRGKIGFDRWLISAKNNLKWNDHCIQLFWDLLSLSISYTNSSDLGGTNASENNGICMVDMNEKEPVDLEYLVIFLILHVPDSEGPSSSSRNAAVSPQSSRFREDTMWPAQQPQQSLQGQLAAQDAPPGKVLLTTGQGLAGSGSPRSPGRKGNISPGSPHSPR